MTAELDEGEMGGEEARQRRREKAQPPPAFQATGPTSQRGWAATDGAAPPVPRARGSWRQVGGEGTGPVGPGRLTSRLLQEFARPPPPNPAAGESSVGGSGGPGRRPASGSSLGRSPLRAAALAPG
ncbi:unnamed protein product [Rangifer tarandus platyrhynchus]|uniref:Uncharacterized protein n=2 Tax=Rangifer tarandus platyrhynchus TaxID=3082113 RepID=A0ABN8ZTS4_RANTA|nr:unnamed protein product [Rangifer tarandus platyrhynchus]CAI9710254.1 unnamed protein product [Rangifer tarandus platyrhynchus]